MDILVAVQDIDFVCGVLSYCTLCNSFVVDVDLSRLQPDVLLNDTWSQ